MLKYFQLQYLKRLQYTAKKMTGLSKVAKEANKGLKFLDTRYIQFGNSFFSLPKCKVVFVRQYLTFKVIQKGNTKR